MLDATSDERAVLLLEALEATSGIVDARYGLPR